MKEAYSGMGLILLCRIESVQGNKGLMFLEFPNEKNGTESVSESLLVVICLISFRQVPLNASSRFIFFSLFAFQGVENRHNYILRETVRFPLISFFLANICSYKINSFCAYMVLD